MTHHGDASSPIPWPPIVLVALLVAGGALTWLVPVGFLPRVAGWWIALALLIAAAGAGLAAAAVMAFRRAATTLRVDRSATALVDTGVYRYSRNPMYLAMATVLLGLAVGFNSLWFLAAVAIFVIAVRWLAIAREEEHLEHRFGQSYVAYKQRVPRWCGLGGPPREG